MEQPYLIQQAQFSDRSNRKGMNAILAFDYMGSAEFEFGSLPESLKRIRENINQYMYSLYSINDKAITIFCKKSELSEILNTLEKLAKKEIQLKERIDFPDWLNNEKHWNDHWWDIDNDFMFWKENKQFEEKFKQLIKGDKPCMQ